MRAAHCLFIYINRLIQSIYKYMSVLGMAQVARDLPQEQGKMSENINLTWYLIALSDPSCRYFANYYAVPCTANHFYILEEF